MFDVILFTDTVEFAVKSRGYGVHRLASHIRLNNYSCLVIDFSSILTWDLYTAILDKQTVLRTKEQDPVLDWNHHQRLVGGKLSNMGLSALSKIVKYHKKNRPFLQHHDPELTAGATSGGVMSGGASSGGVRGRHRLAKHLLSQNTVKKYRIII